MWAGGGEGGCLPVLSGGAVGGWVSVQHAAARGKVLCDDDNHDDGEEEEEEGEDEGGEDDIIAERGQSWCEGARSAAAVECGRATPRRRETEPNRASSHLARGLTGGRENTRSASG